MNRFASIVFEPGVPTSIEEAKKIPKCSTQNQETILLGFHLACACNN